MIIKKVLIEFYNNNQHRFEENRKKLLVLEIIYLTTFFMRSLSNS